MPILDFAEGTYPSHTTRDGWGDRVTRDTQILSGELHRSG